MMSMTQRFAPTTQRFAPVFDDVIGDRSGGRVRLITSTKSCEYVSCEHPEELLHWFRAYAVGNAWVPCDSGALLNTRYIVKAEVEE